ncbi:MAG: hypothetical protein MUF58_10705 [Arcicella sp.]|jgi:hypothetical protein|nr:hypothetical protein [Arcicella sp.]
MRLSYRLGKNFTFQTKVLIFSQKILGISKSRPELEKTQEVFRVVDELEVWDID